MGQTSQVLQRKSMSKRHVHAKTKVEESSSDRFLKFPAEFQSQHEISLVTGRIKPIYSFELQVREHIRVFGTLISTNSPSKIGKKKLRLKS